MSSAESSRLARAIDLFEQRREQLSDLTGRVAALAQIDVIVVDGEHAVLERLAGELHKARALLGEMAAGTAGPEPIDRLEEIVAAGFWTLLDDVTDLLAEKAVIAEDARNQVQPRLLRWEGVMAEIGRMNTEIRTRRLHVVEPWELAAGRDRLTALMRQARTAARDGQLLDVWRALNRLESRPAPTADGRRPVAAEDVRDRLAEVVQLARVSASRLQLIVLRGVLDQDRVEYTLMLSAPGGDRQLGINVEDRSTLEGRNRQEFLDETNAAIDGSYRNLTATGGETGPAAHRLARLRDMGQTLYQLLIPNRLKDEIDKHPGVPMVVITNDRELSWELMYDDAFVALERPLARMPVGRISSRRKQPGRRAQVGRRVALIASAGPGAELQYAIREVNSIATGLRAAWGDEVTIDMFVTGTDTPANGRNVDRVLKSPDYDIVHYAGHARFDRRDPDQSGLLLDGTPEPELCTAQKIQRLLTGSPLVFLNACETARLREPIDRPLPDDSYPGDPKEGLASAFLYRGALACIGNSWPVLDTVAADFAVAFYRGALKGEPLGEAMRAARASTARKHPEDPSWASFVLYGDPGFNLGPFTDGDAGTETP